MRILVTGGAGFIGSNLADALLDGHDVFVLDDLSTGRRENLAAGAELHVADVADATIMQAVLAAVQPEAVLHLAAQMDVRRSVADPAFDARVNVAATAGLLEASRTAGVRRFVFASTGGALYGEAETIPTPEDAPLAPLAPYGTAKAAAETYLALYDRLYGLSTLSLRLANVFGPRQDRPAKPEWSRSTAPRRATTIPSGRSAAERRRATSSSSATSRRRSSRRS